MASNKRSTHLDDPPSASSSDDEDNETQPEEEEDEEDESDQEEDAQNPNPNSNQSEEEDDEEEDESEEEEIPAPIKPPNSPSLDNNSDPDLRSPTASDFAIKPSKKIEPNANSKIKIKFTNNGEDEKKLVNKLVWNDDDEIMLLEAFIECHNDPNFSSVSDFDKFYEFIKEELPGNATYSQVYEKMRRLKKKFRDNCEKVGGSGEGPVFGKAHERRLYEVSKRVWGVDGCVSVNGGGGLKSKSRIRPCGGKRKIEVEVEEMDVDDEEGDGFERMYPYWNTGLNSEALKFPKGVVVLVKECMGLIGEDKAKEMDEKWKAVLENEVVLRKKRIALLSEVENVERRL